MMHSSSENSVEDRNGLAKADKGGAGDKIEQLDSKDQTSGPHYYEKDGLRTVGDDYDHDHEPAVRTCPVSLRSGSTH